MQKMTGTEMGAALSDFANQFHPDEKGFVDAVCGDHRTIQQTSFRLMMACIKKWAEAESFDLRNEQTVLTCRKIMEAIDPDGIGVYLPMV